MAAKRSQSQGSSKDEPPSKKIQGSSSKDNQPLNKSVFLSDPVNIGPVSTEEELDIKVLKFQNAKLYSRLEEKNNQEEEFNNKLAHLERLRQNDRNIISSMNLAWNQLDEDTVLLLKRFQDIPDEARESMSETTVAFLEKLSNRTSKGMREETQKRVNHSGGLIRKLVELIHRVLSRSLDIAKLLHKKKEQVLIFKELKAQRAAKLKQEDGSVSPLSPNDDEAKEEESVFDMSSIDLAVRQENATLKIDNKRLHDTINELHNKNHSLSTEFSVVKDELVTVHKENTELHEKQKEMQYDLQKATKQFEKLIQKLNETAEQAMSGGGGLASTSTKLGIPHQNDDLKHELEAKDELAKSRLNELKKMQETHQKLVEEHEKMKQQMLEVPDEVVINTTKYKVLQTQFNFLFNDAQTIRKNCEDARKILTSNHSQHLSQVGQLENENAQMKKRVRSEVNQLEKALSDSRKELEVLRVEYEHNTKAYEQIVPMSKEMRHLINSLQNHNHQLRDEVQRYKKRITEYDQKTAELEKRLAAGGETPIDYIDRIDIGNSSPRSESSQSSNDESDYDDIKKLRSKLKSAREKRKEMKLLLDMYKGVSKETRDKAELLKNERTLKDEIQVLKAKLLVLTEDAVEQSKRFADDHHKKQCQKLENKIEELQKSIANMKQEEDALLGEMEFTGQAFEEMQEQNIRLLQQLREKDDSNLKLMSERIKANQIQKLLREEKDVLTQQVKVKNEKQMATDELVKKLEEREKILQTALTTLESEANSRMQASECHKRKALEMTTQYQEVLYRTESLNKQLDEATKSMLDKTNRLEEETFKYNRIQEENISLKKKLDRAKKMEFFGASDEILVEEVKLYKGKLMCPCCNTRQKDAIISKCHHVFCYECLKTRYDTRQRKCPKCNGPFGNQDFHKIFM